MEDLMKLPDNVLEALEETYAYEEDAQLYMKSARRRNLTDSEIVVELEKKQKEDEE